MRKYWDVVAMEDYSKDMAHIADSAALIISEQKKEIDQLKSLFRLAVESVGKIEITNCAIQDGPTKELVCYQELDRDVIVYTTTSRCE